MKMLGNKKGKFSFDISGILMGAIGAVVLVAVLAALLNASFPTLVTAFTGLSSNMTANGIPFGTFFAANGVMLLVLGASVIIVMIAALILWMKSMMHGR